MTPEESNLERGAVEHRETYADDSARGVHYPDDRTNLGGVYDGLSLIAMVFDEDELVRYRDKTAYDVVLTPAGEARIDE